MSEVSPRGRAPPIATASAGKRVKVGSPMAMLIVTLLAVNTAWTPPPRLDAQPCGLQGRRRSIAMSEEERRKRLQQLFGEEASKIADRTAPKKKKADEPAREIQMLVEGMQRLEWGAVRLVDVAMTPGPLEASFAPRLPDSDLLSVRLDMPLGMLLEEQAADEQSNADGGSGPPSAVVAELLNDGSARTGGVQEGDVLRACTAVRMAMSYPTWNLLLGGVGKPSLQKVLFQADGESFETVMAALGSNSQTQQGNGQVILFLERSRV